eukprot:s2220_g9.t1
MAVAYRVCVCHEIRELLERDWPQWDLLTAIQGRLSFGLRPILNGLADMICEQAQYDSRMLLEEEIDAEIKWEVVAVWRVLLVFFGHFVEELQPGELENGDALTLEDIAADLDRVIIRQGGLADDVEARNDLREFLCNLQASLVERAQDLIHDDLQQLSQVTDVTVMDQIRAIVSKPWREGCETLAVVYLDHVVSQERERMQPAPTRPVPNEPLPPNSRNDTTAVLALGLVALRVLGEQNCLLPLRVCRGVCSRDDVNRKLTDRMAFSFWSYSGRKVLARGFRTTWPWLVAKSFQPRGDAMPVECHAKYYKTVGPGPELFAIADGKVFYNDEMKWHMYRSAKLESFLEDI